MYENNERLSEKNVDEYYMRLCTKNALNATISVARSVDFRSIEDHVKKIPDIKQETLIVHGENDKWIPVEISHHFKKDLQNSIFYEIPSCGHVPQEEYPDLTAKLIIDFIEGNEIKETSVN